MSRFYRKLGLEKLEERRVLAGNVSASIVNGNLVVIGDDAPKALEITYLSGTAEVRVVGTLNPAPFDVDNCLVNGLSQPALLAGLTGGIQLHLGASRDRC